MKTTCFILMWALFLTTPSHGASTNDLASTFKQGLVEEEANRNLEAAIQAYQQVVVHFDKDRKTAATAIYRLGECYRKLGKTNEAVAQFERVVREFGDDELLVSISRNNLVALRGSSATTEPAARSGAALSAAGRAEQKKLFADEIKLAETELEILKKQHEVGRVEQMALLAKERELLRLKRQAAGVGLTGDIPEALAAPLVTDEEGAEIRRIQQLVQNSPDLINAIDLMGKSPLHYAAERGQVTVVNYLLEHGASIDQPSNRKETALHLAAQVGQNAVVKLLLERKANLEARDSAGWTPLYSAASRGYRAVGETLLERGATANARASDGRTPLHTAADRGSLEFVQLLLQRGAKVDVGDDAGTQPHMSAAASGHVLVIQALLDAGASVNATNRNGATALLFAVVRQHADAVEELLRRKADPHLPGFVALARGEAPPGLRDGRVALYPLEQAVELKDVRITRLLLEAGAKPDLTARKRLSPLWAAVAQKQFELARLLLEHKADPTVKDSLGHSLLTLAMAWQEAPEMLKMLLDAGLDANSPDPDFTTPLLRAVDSLWTEGAALLLQHGALVNAPQSRNGNTPLHFAVGHGSEVMVKLLLENKADVNLRNNEGETPLDLVKPAKASSLRPPLVGRGVAPPAIPGGVAVPTRVVHAGPPGFDKANLEKALREHGARDDLPHLDRLTITRAARGFSQTIFMRQTNDWSHYTLLELLAVQYGLVAGSQGLAPRQSYEGRFLPAAQVVNSFGADARNALPYPDFSRVVIRRPKTDGSGWTDLEVNAQAILEGKEGCHDVPLLWGDEVDVPEADHPVMDSWSYLNQTQLRGFVRCLTKRVHIGGKNETKKVTLSPDVTFVDNSAPDALPGKFISNQPMTLQATLVNAKMVRTSSDLSRVKIRRKNPAVGAPQEWVTSSPVSATGADLWLDDGDEIEIPERPLP